jgi:hypothetical protein
MRGLVFMVAVAAIACGASSTEIKTAKTANYTGDPGEIFKIVLDTTAETYKIANAGKTDEGFALTTVPQWYNPEGGRQSVGEGDYVQIDAGSIRLEMLVEMLSTESRRYLINVTPRTFQHVSGSPQPRELKPDDPYLPGWVSGRVDSLYVEIHKRLQNYATQ